MNILVTGGAGFIGSHVCEYLIGQGHEVVCLDNFSVGKREHVKHLEGNELFTIVEHEVERPVDTLRTVLGEKIDEIYHLACPASPIHYQRQPLKTLNTIVFGTINMLELASLHGARIVVASTSEVYGDPLVHPQPESYWGNVNPVGERSCYDEAKRCAETYSFEYQRQKAADVGVVRIFNTFGPRMAADDGRAVPAFISQALHDEPLTVFGDGSHTRSMQYVDDLVRGLVLMMGKIHYFGPVNLGNPSEEHTMTELAGLIIKLVGSKSTIVYTDVFPADDPSKRRPDTSLAHKELAWEPQVSLETGLQRTIEYFRTIHG